MLARSRSRLTSASPLAGRGGFPFDIENLGAEADIDLDLDMYLQSELDPDRHTVSADADGGSGTATTAGLSRPGMQRKLLASSLDQESLNFLDFLNSKTQPEPDDGGDQHGKQDTTSEITSFSSLLPPENTSRIVATQALMHVLTLATKGFLGVRQDPYVDESSDEVGARYRYGEIFLRLAC